MYGFRAHGHFFFFYRAAPPSRIPLFLLLFLIIKTLSTCQIVNLARYTNLIFGGSGPLPPNGNDIQLFFFVNKMTIYFASYETKIFQIYEFLSGNIHQIHFWGKIFPISFGGTTPLKIIFLKIKNFPLQSCGK